jgi:DNA-binding transcriptional regulator YhcF (GntR family)
VYTDIVLTRRHRSCVRDQLTAQLEMKMLGGEISPGERLPSTRTLARMLGVHPNTVSAAYQRLEELGHVVRRRGAGVFVDPLPHLAALQSPDLNVFVHAALASAVGRGHSGAEIREAAARWLSSPPPERIVAFDPVAEMAQLLARELREATLVPTVAVTEKDLEESGAASRLGGALVVTLPYQVRRLARFLPVEAFEVVTVWMSHAVRRAVKALPSGASLMFVSNASVVLKFARDLVRGMRGDDEQLYTPHFSDPATWRPLLRATDLVLTDAFSKDAIRAAGHASIVEFRIITPQSFDRVKALVELPRNPSTTRSLEALARRRERGARVVAARDGAEATGAAAKETGTRTQASRGEEGSVTGRPAGRPPAERQTRLRPRGPKTRLTPRSPRGGDAV